MPEISIIIPVYNKVKYVEALLNQITNQSLKDFECIIVDDGSADGSEKICDAFAEKDSRIRVIHKENGGVSKARNLGIENAVGRYITFVDCDDEVSPLFLETLYNDITDTNADMSMGGCVKFWDNKDKTIIPDMPFKGVAAIDEVMKTFAKKQYESGLYGTCWNKIFSKQLLGDTRFKEGLKLAEDLEFYLSLYPKLKSISFIDTPHYYYRQEADNSSILAKSNEIDYVAQLEIQLKMHDMLKACNALDEECLALIAKRIYNYVYFAIFHAPLKSIASVGNKLHGYNLPKFWVDEECSKLQRRILMLYFKKAYGRLRLIIGARRIISRIKRGIA